MTTEERLYKLEGIVEGVMVTLPGRMEALENRMTALESRMDLVRQEIKGEIASLRQELKGDMASLRAELKGDINTAINRLMLYFSALAAILALLALWR